MKIAIFASAFHPHFGGVEELVRQLAHQLQTSKIDPIVVTNQWPGSLPAFEEFEGIPVYRFPMRVPEAGIKVQLRYLLTHQSIASSMLQVLRERKIDLVHIQCVSATAHYALVAKRRLNLPLITTLQGELTMDATQLFQRSAFARSCMRASLTDADRITACSGQTLAEAEEFLGKPFGTRGSVIYNGVNLGDFEMAAPYTNPRPYVLGIGRLVTQKGFDVLLRAFAAANAPRSHDLILAGDGPEKPELERLAGELGISNAVRFIGRVGRPEVVRLFSGCSFFVLPSRHEPLGIVNLEAMAAGRAVVASRVGGVPELIQDGVQGLLVNPDDVPSLATALQRMLSDKDLVARLGDNGKAKSLNFDWPVIAGQYVDLYRQLTGHATK